MTFHGAPRIMTCHPSWTWAPLPMPDHDFWCVLAGRGELHLGGTRHTLKPGVCFVFAPGDAPAARHDPAQPLTVLYGHFSDPERWSQRRCVKSEVWDLPLLGHLGRAAVRWHARGDSLGLACAAEQMRQLLTLIERPQPAGRHVPGDHRVAAAAEMIAENPAHPWRNAELGKRLGIAPHYLARLFHQIRGQRLGAYIIEQRVRLAAEMLEHSDAPLAAVAEASGYDDVYYFNRQFRRYMGEPPGRWRERTRRAA